MVSIPSGLSISLIVLELMRNDSDFKNIDVTIGTFTNCRESGLTFRVTSNVEFKSFTFCVYEHRNSDEIIINGKEGYISLNGDLPYIGESKYDYLKAFKYNEHYEVYLYLKELILNWVEKQELLNYQENGNN